jgi:hypothetical protein
MLTKCLVNAYKNASTNAQGSKRKYSRKRYMAQIGLALFLYHHPSYVNNTNNYEKDCLTFKSHGALASKYNVKK